MSEICENQDNYFTIINDRRDTKMELIWSKTEKPALRIHLIGGISIKKDDAIELLEWLKEKLNQ